MAINQILLNQVITAHDLMTPKELFFSIELNNLGQIDNLNSEYDVIPVVDGQKIVGIIEKDIKKVQPIINKWLISHDTSVPDLIDLFIESKQKAFFVLRNQKIVGIVSPADLNKSQARVFIYHLIGELELLLYELLTSHFGNNYDQILQYLSVDRKNKLKKIMADLEDGNTEVNIIQYLNFSELINILCKEKNLWRKIGFQSRNQVENHFNGLADLRNNTIHLVRPLVESIPEGLYSLDKRIERIEKLLEILDPKK